MGGEVKGCPFCGDAPITEPQSPQREGDAWTRIRCGNVGCQVNPHVSAHADTGHLSMAATRWNTRVPDNEELRKAVAWGYDKRMMDELVPPDKTRTDWELFAAYLSQQKENEGCC